MAKRGREGKWSGGYPECMHIQMKIIFIMEISHVWFLSYLNPRAPSDEAPTTPSSLTIFLWFFFLRLCGKSYQIYMINPHASLILLPPNYQNTIFRKIYSINKTNKRNLLWKKKNEKKKTTKQWTKAIWQKYKVAAKSTTKMS